MMDMKLIAICITCFYCMGYVAANGHCYTDVVGACSRSEEVQNCNAKYGAFKGDELLFNVQNYAQTHIMRSFQYLLMSTYFGNYEKSREGFEKLFRKLSDQTWEQAIDLVKFIGKRGGYMEFRSNRNLALDEPSTYEIHEFGSMARALDMQKKLATDAFFIHAEVTRKKEHDSEVASYIENNFVHQHADNIRQLSGHTNDLKHLIGSQTDPSLALYLFDEYLKTTV